MGNFRHLKLNDQGQEKVEKIQVLFEELDRELSYLVGPGRENSLVTTQLELACFWAKKGVSLQKENQVGGDLRHHTGPRTQVEATVDKIGEDIMDAMKAPLPAEPAVIMGLSQQIQLPPVGTGNNSSGVEMTVKVRHCICFAEEDVQGWHTPACDLHDSEMRKGGA